MKRIQNKIIRFVMFLLLIGCALESKFALPNDEEINSEILGEWLHEKNNEERIIIEKHNDKTYKILIVDQDDTDELFGFSKTIKGYYIMNIISEYQNNISNVFYGFDISEDTFTFYEVNDQLHPEEFESDLELLKFFEDNINKDDFFINPTTMKRE